MIGLLTGQVVYREKQTILLQTSGGVGYRVMLTPLSALECAPGMVITLETYLRVSDSALDLFGFRTHDERVFFELLLTVSGVGPKTALGILSLGTVRELEALIGKGDVRTLTSLKGMGKKTAERLVVELQSKVGVLDSSDGTSSEVTSATPTIDEAIEALVAIGYDRKDAMKAVERVEKNDTTSVQEIIRQVLRAQKRA